MVLSSSDGLRMPAEWSTHERTLVAWPQREEAWRGTTIEAARDSHTEVIAAISQFEPVLVAADPSQADDARRRLPAENVEVFAVPIDDSWLRDSGPIVVTGERGARAGVDFRFNAWGEAFTPYDNDAAVSGRILDHLGIERLSEPMVLEGGSIAVDGEGLLITTEQCLLDPTRNPGLGKHEIDAELSRALGVERVVWLDRGLLEDADTDGHVDNICAFIEPGRAMLQTVADESDPNWAATRENVARLAAAGVETVEWELLPRIEREDGEPVVVPYMNFYIANGALIVPVGGIDPDMDQEALSRLSGLFPGREAIGIDGRVLALGGGGIHCITQQIPLSAD
ncbi:MAG TPA: agmatine deiminase family protein [Solirubrobacterales bacterium]|nr:agmatine deiminase family protein [Solirubrobacterales bacterium]